MFRPSVRRRVVVALLSIGAAISVGSATSVVIVRPAVSGITCCAE